MFDIIAATINVPAVLGSSLKIFSEQKIAIGKRIRGRTMLNIGNDIREIDNFIFHKTSAEAGAQPIITVYNIISPAYLSVSKFFLRARYPVNVTMIIHETINMNLAITFIVYQFNIGL